MIFLQQFYSMNGCMIGCLTWLGAAFLFGTLCLIAGFPVWMMIFLPPLAVVGVWIYIYLKVME